MENIILKEGLVGLRRFFVGSKKRAAFSVWLLLALGLWIFSGEKSTIISAIGVLIGGFSTFFFWIFRESSRRLINHIKLSPRNKFILVGSLGAFWLELEFWILEKIFNVSVAASPNVFLDLLVTMPWYIIMVFLLWQVEKKYSYSFYLILIYGGLYDFFADGIFGTIIGTGGLPLEGILLIVATFPVFIISYSFIVLPPSYLLKEELNQIRKETAKPGLMKFLYGLLPLVGLLAYGIIMFLLFSGR